MLVTIINCAHVAGYLKNLGCDLVCELSGVEDATLLESQKEFVKRKGEGMTPLLASACPGQLVTLL